MKVVLVLVVFVQRAGLEKDLMAYLSQCLIIKDYQSTITKVSWTLAYVYDDNNKTRETDDFIPRPNITSA